MTVALVTFDFESRWGMPRPARYDLQRATDQILEVLAAHDATATFFVVGELAVERDDLMGAIAGAGHEIGLHGWQHEDLAQLRPGAWAGFRDGLDRAIAAVGAATGTQPAGFRAPYLLAPRFFEPRVHELLAERGFRYTSNREIRHPVELLRPDRLRGNAAWRGLQRFGLLQSGRAGVAIRVALNPGVWSGVGWLLHGCPPFYRDGILELPLYAPLDCDLIGLPRPTEPTPAGLLDYGAAALRACLRASGPLALLTYHDWIVAGTGRIKLLRAALAYAGECGRRPSSVRDAWDLVVAEAR